MHNWCNSYGSATAYNFRFELSMWTVRVRENKEPRTDAMAAVVALDAVTAHTVRACVVTIAGLAVALQRSVRKCTTRRPQPHRFTKQVHVIDAGQVHVS